MAKRHDVVITKSSGEHENFNVEKLAHSLRKSGAKGRVVDAIIEHIEGELKTGMHTSYIYKHAFSLLRKLEKHPVAARYSIRRAVLELGPTGYPFEKYAAEIFKGLGYTTATQQMVEGKCSTHEVDLVAYNDDQSLGAEVKFHNSLGIKSDLKVALYVRARFDDIQKAQHEKAKGMNFNQAWLITNTKFTHNAISYSKCANLILLGWNYPNKRSLEDLIMETHIYPITSIPSLSKREKDGLLEQRLVLCRDLSSEVEALRNAGVRPSKIATVIEESQALCSS